jgi:hypothetical protein
VGGEYRAGRAGVFEDFYQGSSLADPVLSCLLAEDTSGSFRGTIHAAGSNVRGCAAKFTVGSING